MKFVLFFSFYLTHIFAANATECPVGKYPVSAHARTDYYRNDGTYVSGTQVTGSCREFRFQEPLVIKFSRKTPKGWPHNREKFRDWTNKEKSEITNALNELPVILTQVGELRIYRAVKSEISNNPATTAPAEKIITLYDIVSKHDLKRVLAHELAHILFVSLSDKDRDFYLETASWKRKNKVFETSRTFFIAEDGSTGPEEDFSNNIEYYFFEKKMLERDQVIYKWIKNFLGDL